MTNYIMFSPTKRMEYKTTGSRSIGLSGASVYSNRNNKLAFVNGANPPSFYPATQGYTSYGNARKTYIKDAGGGQGYHDSSQLTELKRITAVGKSTTQHQNHLASGFSNGGPDRSFTATARQRARSGGCTAPKKKGALNNSYRSGGSSRLTTSGNRQVYAP